MQDAPVTWSSYAATYAKAQAVFPWSDVAQFAIVDRSRTASVDSDARLPSQTGNFDTAPRASHSGDAVIVFTGGDGGWKVLVRESSHRPQDIPPGDSMICRLDAPSGELVIHDGSVALSLHECEADDPYHPLEGEQVTAQVAPGRYLVQVTRPAFEEADGDEPDDVRAPDYIIDLWPEQGSEPVTLTWQRLG